jgi:hypothetical protein
MTPELARRTWRSMEAVHGMIYFTPEGPPAYAAAGLSGNRTGYFASRSAPMGAVPAEVVIATFFNFHPGLVRRAMRDAWTASTPERVLEARLTAVDRSLRTAFGDPAHGEPVLGSDDVAWAAERLRAAAEVACEHPEGRPLFAGHASLPWPDEPHLVLWHAQTLLREFRGDGHVAALTAEGLSGIDALVSHGASGDVPAEVLRLTRSWSPEEWTAAVSSMTERGLVLPDGTFTEAGRAQRDRIEAATDRLAVEPYATLGDDECERLRAIGKDLSRRVVAAGLLTADVSRLDD